MLCSIILLEPIDFFKYFEIDFKSFNFRYELKERAFYIEFRYNMHYLFLIVIVSYLYNALK